MQQDKVSKIVAYNGEYMQVSKAVEELIELTEVLIKDLNKSIMDKDHLLEEIADVEIMLAQLKIIYRIAPEDLEAEINRKLDRTLLRFNTDYEGGCDSCMHINKECDEDPCVTCNHNGGKWNKYEPYGKYGKGE